MKNKRMMLFRLGAVLLLLIIAGIMMIIGRGHTVYFDNKTLDYNGQTYSTPYEVEVYVDGERMARLRNRERGMATCIGQTFHTTLVITEEKGGAETTMDVTLKLPYHMDGVSINLPAYLAGLPEEAYLSEFEVVMETVEEETESGESDELAPVDEFEGLGDI